MQGIPIVFIYYGEKLKKKLAGEVPNKAAHAEELALLAKDSNTAAEANAVKIDGAILGGLIKFFEAIAAEIPTKLAESETAGGGAVEMANALTGELVYYVDKSGVVDDIKVEIARDALLKEEFSTVLQL